MLQITADMFSGRPNPTLSIEAEEARNLLRDVARNPSIIAPVDEGYQGLGYRGLIVEAMIDNIVGSYGLPPRFRVAHTEHPTGLEIGERVFDLMRRARVIDERLHSFGIEGLHGLRSLEETTEADQSAPPAALVAREPARPEAVAAAAVTCWIELGRFNPGFWNDPAHVWRNNCYNYASNRRTDTFAQPGRQPAMKLRRWPAPMWLQPRCPTVCITASTAFLIPKSRAG